MSEKDPEIDDFIFHNSSNFNLCKRSYQLMETEDLAWKIK